MIELPEAAVISRQINESLAGKKVMNVIAAQSPHKFAWFHGDPHGYHSLFSGKVVEGARGHGGMIEIQIEDAVLLFGDGVSLRYHEPSDKRPQKHQLLLEFEDFSALSASVQMYGGLWGFKEGTFDNKYYQMAKEKPSPLSVSFDRAYFESILAAPGAENLGAKALLATEQRIPGLGNGVLQDILYISGIHPKKKLKAMIDTEKEKLFESVKSTLSAMTFKGGRDTEKDLYGCSGGYTSFLSKNTAGKACPECNEIIRKEAYMGGSIYYCPGCQKLD